jgi:hypothetical protein
MREIRLNEKYKPGKEEGQFSDLINQFFAVLAERQRPRKIRKATLLFTHVSNLSYHSSMPCGVSTRH